jgi:hypothetical protein
LRAAPGLWQSAAQKQLAALVPGAVHITDTHSGHNIMIDNAPVVIQAIRMVVDAVRAGQGRCPLRVVQARMPARAT